MRKKLFVLTVCVLAMIGMTACGSSTSYDKYDLNEYIKVGKYKGLEVEGYTVAVSEGDIETQIQADLESAAENKEVAKEDTVKHGDTVNIDYVGKKDGKEFDGGSAEGYDLEIGSDSFIDGFEDGLIGCKIGDKVKLNLTFPENYNNTELAGQDVVFEVKINSATRNVVPEYNLVFVKESTEYKSIEAYEDAVEKMLYDQKELEAVNTQKNDLWDQVMDNTEVLKYPEKILDYYMDTNSKYFDKMAKAYGVTREELLGSYEISDENEYRAVNEDSSKFRIKQEMVVEYIAAKEGIEYTQEDIDAKISEFEQAGYDETAIKDETGRTMDEYARITVLLQKVIQFLLDNAVIK